MGNFAAMQSKGRGSSLCGSGDLPSLARALLLRDTPRRKHMLCTECGLDRPCILACSGYLMMIVFLLKKMGILLGKKRREQL